MKKQVLFQKEWKSLGLNTLKQALALTGQPRLLTQTSIPKIHAELDALCEHYLMQLCLDLGAAERAELRMTFQEMRNSERLHDYLLHFEDLRKPIASYLEVKAIFHTTFEEKPDEEKCKLLYAYDQVKLENPKLKMISRAMVTAKYIHMEGVEGVFNKKPQDYPGVGLGHDKFFYTDPIRHRARP